MNYAIYFVAVGEPAVHCLSYAYESLRKAGFEGDVYILAEHSTIPFNISSNTQVMQIRQEDLNLDLESTEPMATCDVRRFNLSRIDENKHHSIYKWAIANVRTLIDSYIPVERYDYVLYLDVDILTQGPMESFEKFLEENRGAIITSASPDSRFLGGRKNFSLRKLRRAQTTEAGNLTTWELLKYWFVRPICSDIVCFPVTDVGREFIKKWREECQKGIYQDQSALQAILLRNFRKIHVLAPYSLFGYGMGHRKYKEGMKCKKVHSTFAHFGGAIKDPRALEEYAKHCL